MLAAALLSLVPALLPASGAALPERAVVSTRLVARPVAAEVLLPPSYALETRRRYPVVYFLHDGRGNEHVLFGRGVADDLVAGMRAGTLPEMLVVCPRGVGTWFVDAFGGASQYAAFLTGELVPWVDARYRTIPSRAGRAALGISMGGYGALRWGLTEPGLFAAIGGLSPAIQQLTWESVQAFPFFLRPSVTRVFGSAPTQNVLRKNDLYDIVLSTPGLAREAPFVFVRCGSEDGYRLAEITGFFRKFLDAAAVPNEVVVEPGSHDWSYWRRALPELVRSLASRMKTGDA